MTALGKLVPILDHLEQAKNKLLRRYENKPRFAALLDSYVQQIQDLEDAAWGVIASRDVDTADETRLDILGRLVGQPRRGATLEAYRLYVKTRILVNRSMGTAAEIVRIATLLLIDQAPTYTEGEPAYFLLSAPNPLHADVDLNVFKEMVRDAKAAGVGAAFEYLAGAPEDAFLWADGTPLDSDTQGWGDSGNLSYGGQLSSVLNLSVQ